MDAVDASGGEGSALKTAVGNLKQQHYRRAPGFESFFSARFFEPGAIPWRTQSSSSVFTSQRCAGPKVVSLR